MKKQIKMALLAFALLLGVGVSSANAQVNLLQQIFEAQIPQASQAQLPQNNLPQTNQLQLLPQLQVKIIAQQNCLSAEQIQQAINSKKILSLNIVIANAGIKKTTKILPPISVCKINGVLFYKFSILTKNGKTKKLTLPATAPLS